MNFVAASALIRIKQTFNTLARCASVFIFSRQIFSAFDYAIEIAQKKKRTD